MSTFTINIKWKGKVFEVPLDTSEPATTFKSQLFSLTGVPVEKQKIMVKGGMLKDDHDWSKLPLTNGMSWMMMGNAGEGLKAPEKRPIFVEDMADSELAKIAKIPNGFENYGNTCYLNSTLQCMRAIPELRASLSHTFSAPESSSDSRRNLALAVHKFYEQAGSTVESTGPFVLLQTLRMAFPQFAEREQSGGNYMQQDAEEAWAQIVSSIRDSTKVPEDTDQNFVDKYMSLELIHTMKAEEAPTEEPIIRHETMYKLGCHISVDTNFLQQAIKNSLTEKVEKMSESLQKQTTYTQTSEITRLPAYLTVHFIRFFWKPVERVRAKILRKVKFPTEGLDLTEFCSNELQEKMKPTKVWVLGREDEISRSKKSKKAKLSAENGPSADEEKSQFPTEAPVHETLKSDAGCNPSGLYDLQGVVTHLGRSSDSGHYVGWVRSAEEHEKWFKFDDDRVTPVTTEEIKKLDGGGDWHMAYILLYRRKDLNQLSPRKA